MLHPVLGGHGKGGFAKASLTKIPFGQLEKIILKEMFPALKDI
jgi:hypothetical protein